MTQAWSTVLSSLAVENMVLVIHAMLEVTIGQIPACDGFG